MKVASNEIRKYYDSNPELILPEFSDFRQYRLAFLNSTLNKVMYCIPQRIKHPNELLDYCKHFQPYGVYHTVATFAYPQYIKMKGSIGSADSKTIANCFLWSDLVIDVDEGHCTEDNLRLLYSKLCEINENVHVLKTGTGYHFHIKQWSREVLSNYAFPSDREKKDLSMRKKLIRKLKKAGCLFDYKVVADTRRIVRVEGSMHQNGNIITSLSSLNPPWVEGRCK